eukprot:1688865-Lingulodinium_polyedra.AAC.1
MSHGTTSIVVQRLQDASRVTAEPIRGECTLALGGLFPGARSARGARAPLSARRGLLQAPAAECARALAEVVRGGASAPSLWPRGARPGGR